MTLRIYIEEGIQKEEDVIFTISDLKGLETIHPMERMITDSTENNFVYLIDGESQFNQLHFAEQTWPLLETVLQTKRDPYVVIGEETIQLPNFVEELAMLIENIEGNDNYGAQFVQAVETTFANVLQLIE
ncbi:MAG TPA: hypothetical protein VK120_06115 [Sporosarcina sp.]|nr:hypothetical protein [Sporosarcina sp.]